LGRDHRPDRIGRGGESDEESVTLRFDLNTMMRRDRRTNDQPVPLQRGDIDLTEPLE
jgi:hypothetical protein